MLTRCPACGTTFRVREELLVQAGGRVRCGHCQEPFDAKANLLDTPASAATPVSAAPAPAEADAALFAPPPTTAGAAPTRKRFLARSAATADAAAEATTEEAPAGFDAERTDVSPEPLAAAPEARAAVSDEPAAEPTAAPATEPVPEPVPTEPTPDATPATSAAAHSPTGPVDDEALDDDGESDADDATQPAPAQHDDLDFTADAGKPLAPLEELDDSDEDDEPADGFSAPGHEAHGHEPEDAHAEDEAEGSYLDTPKPARRAPWLIGTALLAIALVFQVLYAARVDLAKQHPNLRPRLTALCATLGCEMPLPRDIDQVGIETSDLHPETSNPNRLQLVAQLKNRATYPQAYPNLELTLTDVRNQPVLRRVFEPAEYLPADAGEVFGPGAELPIKLRLEQQDVGASGYLVYVFYP